MTNELEVVFATGVVGLLSMAVGGLATLLWTRKQRAADLEKSLIEIQKGRLEIEEMKRSTRDFEQKQVARADALEQRVESRLDQLLKEQVLPALWKSILDVKKSFEWLLAIQRGFQNLNGIAEEDVQKIVSGFRMADLDKKAILGAKNRNEEMFKLMPQVELRHINAAFEEFKRLRQLHRILIDEALDSDLDAVEKLFNDTYWTAFVAEQNSDPHRRLQAHVELEKGWSPLELKIRLQLRGIIRSEANPAPAEEGPERAASSA